MYLVYHKTGMVSILIAEQTSALLYCRLAEQTVHSSSLPSREGHVHPRWLCFGGRMLVYILSLLLYASSTVPKDSVFLVCLWHHIIVSWRYQTRSERGYMMKQTFRVIKLNGKWGVGTRNASGHYSPRREGNGYLIFETKKAAQDWIFDAQVAQEKQYRV